MLSSVESNSGEIGEPSAGLAKWPLVQIWLLVLVSSLLGHSHMSVFSDIASLLSHCSGRVE
jgi:hypothetical protein